MVNAARACDPGHVSAKECAGTFDSTVLLSRNSWMIPMLMLAAVNVYVILILE